MVSTITFYNNTNTEGYLAIYCN